jgi:hypothetical protein
MCFDVFGEDKITQFNIQVGEELTVHFDVDAREWQGRWFTSINAYRVTRVAANPMNNEPMMQEPPFAADPFGQPAPMQNDPFSNTLPSDSGEDLPF